MPRAWSDKRERQYEHIKEGLEDRGRLARPASAWAVRIFLIGVAGLCFFTVARLLGTR